MMDRTPETPRETLPGFPDVDEVRTQSERARGIFSADRLERFDKERFDKCVELLAQPGLSQREIADILDMSRNSVRRVLELAVSRGAIEPHRRIMTGKLAALERMTVERIAEVMDEEKPKDLKALTIQLGIVFDKRQIACGGPTEIIQHNDGPNVRNFDEWFAGLPQAELVSDGRANGIDGGNPMANGPAIEIQTGDQARDLSTTEGAT